MKSSFIRRVTIRNYKSISACQVDLGTLMFFVGPNGSGKSNFLDALRFVEVQNGESDDATVVQRRGSRPATGGAF